MTTTHSLPRIVLDLDGVIADFNAEAVRRFGPCDEREYDLSRRWPDQAEAVLAWVSEPTSYTSLPLIPDAGLLNTLISFERIVVTARPGRAVGRRLAKEWLTANSLWAHDVFVVDAPVKARFIQSLNPVAVVDDSPAVLTELAALGLPALVFDQPYNRLPALIDLPRASGWPNLLEIIRGLAL